MRTDYPHEIIQKYAVANSVPGKDYREIKDYYDIAGPDYETWSRNFNMHFGYCQSLKDIFFLEKMLVNMNAEVLKQLQVNPHEEVHIADLGCGVCTVARYAARKFPLAKITGITISDYQIEKGASLINKENLNNQVSVVKDNFEDLHYANNYFTHAYALESACYAGGADKENFISEMTRVLKPGGRFCIADGFIKHDHKLPRFFSFLYKKVLRYWALPCFGNIRKFEEKLKHHGLTDITIREISLHIAPSVAYVPWVCLKFFAKEIWKNKGLRMKKERWHNVYGSILGMILGLYRKHFGYYIISGKKK
jgi:ubiquinone/menaquinone biosynthesis C-methylase UbiE